MAVLISLSGLPGVGKTTVARELAQQITAVHLRVDTVEAALRRSTLRIHPAEDAGYVVLSSLAADNLVLGLDVIADTVNAVDVTRRLWADTAARSDADLLNVEVVCSDRATHRDRVERRASDIEGMSVPGWAQVSDRTFEPWRQSRILVDTSQTSAARCAAAIAEAAKTLKATAR